MKSILGLIVLCSASLAHARPSTVNMTCAQAAELVRVNGAIVLSTGDGTYDRFVADQSYCAYDEMLKPAWVQTRDASACYIGFTCGFRDNL
jgi:hypothetical protein